MRVRLGTALFLGSVLALAVPALAQAPRLDAIWARSTNGAPITLDGVLDEPAWAQAESWVLRYGKDNGIPGSGYKEEAGKLARDSTYAVLKFLVVGNQLYLGAVVSDSSVGGSMDFNRFDGFLMALKDHASFDHPAPPSEYFYSWWHPDDPNPTAPGMLPGFRGRWSTNSDTIPRTAEQIANWDAVTRVHGISNSDAAVDTGYTVEMRFNLTPMGYDVTQPQGDIVEWNISIYDCDWFWPMQLARFSSNRAWWQGPWGNAAWYDEVHIFARPDVTVSSGPVPTIPPEVRVPNAGNYAGAVVDGNLNDPVWSMAPAFDIRYGDDALRLTYPGVGPWRAGQFQPTVNGGQAAVVDPGDATVRWFFKDDTLFLGFDVRDQVVQYHPIFDRQDGFIVSINDRVARWRDRNLESRRLTFIVGAAGNAQAMDWLPYLRDSLNGARVALQLKGGTTVDTLGMQADSGYTAELAVDLTKIGYPNGRGDGSLFIGIDLLDGDSFTPFTDSYGTRTWWFRQYEHECCPAWAYLDPNDYLTTAVEPGKRPVSFALFGNFPNPFRHFTTIRYAVAGASDVTLEVYDIQGRMVARRALGFQQPGESRAVFHQEGLRTGLYLYRLRMTDPVTGAVRATLPGKMMFVK